MHNPNMFAEFIEGKKKTINNDEINALKVFASQIKNLGNKADLESNKFCGDSAARKLQVKVDYLKYQTLVLSTELLELIERIEG